MDYSTEFIKTQKQKLEQKRKDVTGELNRLKSEDPFIEEYLEGVRNVDTDDDALELTGHQETVQKIVSLKNSLEQIAKALEQIKEGTYGYDENTGELIGKDRLVAYPEATTKV